MMRVVLERIIVIGIAIVTFAVTIPLWVAFIAFAVRLAQAWGWL